MQNMRPDLTERGFTLIELMVAMAVLAFGILGFMLLQGRGTQGRTAGREMGRATIVAASYCETLQLLDYEDPLLAIGAHPKSTAAEDTDGTVDGKLSTKYGNFVYETIWSVTQNSTDLKTIVITTSWQLKDNQKGLQSKNLVLTLLKGK